LLHNSNRAIARASFQLREGYGKIGSVRRNARRGATRHAAGNKTGVAGCRGPNAARADNSTYSLFFAPLL